MIAIRKYISSISIVFNIYTICIWLYVFNTYSTHTERVNKFLAFFPKGFSTSLLDISLIILTAISLFFLLKMGKPWLFLIPIQIAFMVWYLWQSM
jgi:hypothetical protein